MYEMYFTDNGYEEFHRLLKETVEESFKRPDPIRYNIGVDPNSRQYNIYKDEEQYTMTEREGYISNMYKVTLRLKLKCRNPNTPNIWEFHLRNEMKIVNQNLVSFYVRDLLSAIQSFDIDEVEKFTIEYNNIE
jgi:hypothetical protein